VAAGLCIFWLPLVLSEQIERLVLEGQRGFLLQNGGFEGGSANRTNLVLSRAAIMKRSGQRANQFENVWNVQRGELGGLSGKPVSACLSELDWSRPHISFAARNCRRLPAHEISAPPGSCQDSFIMQSPAFLSFTEDRKIGL
jgi:hypothetical protein